MGYLFRRMEFSISIDCVIHIGFKRQFSWNFLSCFIFKTIYSQLNMFSKYLFCPFKSRFCNLSEYPAVITTMRLKANVLRAGCREFMLYSVNKSALWVEFWKKIKFILSCIYSFRIKYMNKLWLSLYMPYKEQNRLIRINWKQVFVGAAVYISHWQL